MPEPRFAPGFGIFDFFAYIVPGAAALLPLLYVEGLPPTATGNDVLDGLALLLAAYVVGLMCHGLGRTVERVVLVGRRGFPSSRAFQSPERMLGLGIGSKLRNRIVSDFGLDEATQDSSIWDVASRYVHLRGASARAHQFHMMSSMARGLEVVAAGWVVAAFGLGAFYRSATLAFAGVLLLIATLFFERMRSSYSERLVDEVLITYHMLRTDEDKAAFKG